MRNHLKWFLKWFWATRRRRRWVMAFAVLLLVLPVASVELTSQSWFCNSCHIMNPYYSSWKTGSHKDIECVNCHIPPGVTNFVSAKLNGLGQVVDDVLSRTASKPSATVSDASCTRSGCHSLESVRANNRREAPYFFDHSKHIGLEYSGIEVHCTTCHAHVQGTKHFEITTNACVTCHLMKKTPTAATAKVQLASLELTSEHLSAPTTMPAGKADKRPPSQCKSCHDAPTKPIQYRGLTVVHAEYLSYGAQCESCHSNVTDKPQQVKDDACFTCHEFGMEKLGTVADTHRVHSSGPHKVECFSCHGVTRHGPVAQSMQLDQIDCQSCHQGQHAIQQKAYKTIEVAPADNAMAAHAPAAAGAVSPMFLVHVNCTGCHIDPRPVSTKPNTGATVAAASVRACDNCHKPGLGEQMVPLWQKTTHELYDGVAKLMPPPSATLAPDAAQWVTDARSLLELVRLDGSWGAHNPRYTQKLLEDAQQKVLAARGTMDQKKVN